MYSTGSRATSTERTRPAARSRTHYRLPHVMPLRHHLLHSYSRFRTQSAHPPGELRASERERNRKGEWRGGARGYNKHGGSTNHNGTDAGSATMACECGQQWHKGL
eukprot:2710896-Pleurochrysis_carterae.AAC.1